jgi:ABC-type branched-subunit amino acid transport system substrate-binding protein
MLLRPVVMALSVCVALAGCPRQTSGGVRPPVPTDGDRQARTRFLEAQRAFEADAGAIDAAAFAEIAAEYPDDPIAPMANLYAGMAAKHGERYADAIAAFTAAAERADDERVVARATLLRGMSAVYVGDLAAARPALLAGEAALDGDAERVEWHACLAAALAAGPAPLEALPHYDAFFAAGSEVERAFVVGQVELLVAAADDAAAKTAWAGASARRGPSAAVLAYRMAAIADGAGDAAGAKAQRDGVFALRQAVGLPVSSTAAAPPAGGGDPGLLGAVLPGSGKQARVGELALQALALAVRAGGDDDAGVGPSLEQRGAVSADETTRAVEALIDADAIAVLGAIDAAAVDAAGAVAEARSVPLVSLSPRPEERVRGEWVFHVMHSAEARARALARRAVAGGVTTFGVMAPDSGYGRAVAAAFVAEVEALGAKVVEQDTYAADTKSFASAASKLGKGWDALFIPDQADKLELAVPAIAAAGVAIRALGTKAGSGRSIILLSTAEGLATDFVADAGRHAVGALLAPGFYPDVDDAAIGRFVRAYQAEFSLMPTVVEAYAYDAAAIVLDVGATGRADLRAKLAGAAFKGVTGTVSFAGGLRADDGVLFEVEKTADTAAPYALRARR